MSNPRILRGVRIANNNPNNPNNPNNNPGDNNPANPGDAHIGCKATWVT